MDDEGYLDGHQADRRGKPGRHSRVPVKGTPTMDQRGFTRVSVHGRGTLYGYPGAGGVGSARCVLAR